jgi:pimeloyl-ACP methyl ester carboxylesterase
VVWSSGRVPVIGFPTVTTRLDLSDGTVELLDLAGSEPPVVLLHEGLGSVGLWRDFPGRVQAATGARVIAFSRHGHGRSSPPPKPRTPAFFFEEAREVLPEVLSELGIESPVLVGHSDGATIALLHAAEHDVKAVVAMAPHVFVEDVCLAGITQIRADFESGELRARMARHHDDPDAAFWGWAGVWLDPDFRDWDVTGAVGSITAPLLLIQGREDEYGTLAQLDRIEGASRVPVQRLVVSAGHSPHLDQPAEVVSAIASFLADVS